MHHEKLSLKCVLKSAISVEIREKVLIMHKNIVHKISEILLTLAVFASNESLIYRVIKHVLPTSADPTNTTFKSLQQTKFKQRE